MNILADAIRAADGVIFTPSNLCPALKNAIDCLGCNQRSPASQWRSDIPGLAAPVQYDLRRMMASTPTEQTDLREVAPPKSHKTRRTQG
jgi:hypothetical protein